MNKNDLELFIKDRIAELIDYRNKCHNRYRKDDKRTLDARRCELQYRYYSGAVEELYHILKVLEIEVIKNV